jgi:hypothetical protein
MKKSLHKLVTRPELAARVARRPRTIVPPPQTERERAAAEALRAYFDAFARHQADPVAVDDAAVEAARALLAEALRAADAEYAQQFNRRRPGALIIRPIGA